MATDHIQEEKESNAPITIENIQTESEVYIEEDFKWSLNVILNLTSLYFSSWACIWMFFGFAVSLAYINETFPEGSSDSPWIAAVGGLAQCVISLFIGELSDIFDRRWFIVIGNFLTMTGNLISSRGSSVAMIIGGQVIAGIGVSSAYLAIPAMAEMVPKSSRSLIIAIATGTNGCLAAGGTLIIGVCTRFEVGGARQGWRMGGYLGTALGFIAFVLTFFFLHPASRPKPEGMGTKQRLQMIDYFGIFIGITSLTLILLGLHFGGVRFAWSSVQVLCLLIIGGVCLIVFGVWEVYVPFGLFPKPLFKHRNYSIMLGTQFVEGMAYNIPGPFLSQMTYALYTTDAIMVQVRNLSFSLSPLIGALICAGIIHYTKESKWVTIGTVMLPMIGVGLISLLKPSSSYALWFFGTVLMGTGVAGMGVCVNVIASICTPNQLIATAITLCNSTRGLGAAVGVVIFAQIYQSKLLQSGPEYITAAALREGLPETSLPVLIPAFLTGNVTAISNVPGTTPAIVQAVAANFALANARSFAFMWYSLIPFFGVTWIATLFLKRTKDLTTEEVAAKVQDRHGLKQKSEDIKL